MATVRDWFLELGWTEVWAVVGAIAVGLAVAALLAELARVLGQAILSRVARQKKKKKWIDVSENRHVGRGFAWVVLVLIAERLTLPLLASWPTIQEKAETLLDGALVVLVTMAISRLIAAAVDALEMQEGTEQRPPYKVLGQALQVVVWAYGTITALSVLTHRDVSTLLTGMTAVGAVLVYVFRDLILGWTASVQIAANDLARLGDWISVPGHDANGLVIDITLTTIKVQNGDKTISTVPNYALVSGGFRNWRGMFESGGRRIKRSISIDVASIQSCDESQLKRLKDAGLLQLELETVVPRPTNLTCFRHWLEAWLREHPDLHDDMPTLVRELPDEGRGIPVEIYAFSQSTAWSEYEHLQAGIFDHAIAVLSGFDLRLFQELTRDDVRELRLGV